MSTPEHHDGQPGPRLTRRLPGSRRPAARDALALGALIILVAAFYSHYALRIGTFQDDEELFTRLARYIAANFPQGLWAPYYTRGLQRLDPLVMAIPFSFMRGPGAFEVDHVIQCLLFASTALPVFLTARAAGLGRPLGYLTALLSVILPWGVVSTSFLSESLAYPAFAWVLYTAWLAACRPSLRNEALALVALVIAAFSRTALLGMLPLAPLAVLWQTLSCELAGDVAARLRAAPARLWRRHRLMTIVLGAGIIGYAAQLLGLLPANVSNTLTGSYGLPKLGSLGPTWAKDRSYLSRMIAGSGYIAFAFAIAWMSVTFIRRREARLHGLAVVCLLGLLCELLSLLPAGMDERYVMYGAIPIILGFAAALRERVGLAVVGGAIVTVLLIDSVTWPALASLYDYFTYPAATFYSRVLSNHLDHLPLIHVAADRVIEAGILILAILWVLATRSERLARPTATLLALAVLGLGATQTVYALKKYAGGAGAGQPASARSWVDRHVPAGDDVSTLAISLGTSLNYVPIWREAEFWNTSIKSTAFFGYPGYAPLPLELAPFSLTIGGGGVLSATEYGAPVAIPHYMLVPRLGTLPIGLAAQTTSEDPALPLNLLRLQTPPRVLWLLTGTSTEGFMAPHEAAEIHLYPPAPGTPRCVSLTLVGPPNYLGRWPYTILEAGRAAAKGRLTSQQRVHVVVPVGGRAAEAQPTLEIRVGGDGILYPSGEVVSARIEDVTTGPCTGPS